jgi:CheY-like chemotaxis protein/anti-sigma regulatory factor (Ser/Thr protein kinase)
MRLAGDDARALTRAREMMERQMLHMVRLVDDLLDVSRIARGKLSLYRRRLDLGHLVRTAAEDRRPLLEYSGRSLALELPAEPVWVSGDPDRLAQAVDNLLTNAHKFTDAGHSIRVRVEADPGLGRALVSVRDNGIGIDPALVPQVFQRYLQAQVDTDRAQGGLGLGLALVKGLVELHGGGVTAHSAGAGAGASFSFWLPTDATAAPAEPPAAPAAAAPPRLLVIEDNRDGADSLAMLLRLFGYDVCVTYTGPEGVAAAQAEPPDVVLCDLALPGMDGYAVARALRADPAMADTVLIAVSGHGGEADRQQSREAGFVRHVLKPVEPDDLQRLLKELVWRTDG